MVIGCQLYESLERQSERYEPLQEHIFDLEHLRIFVAGSCNDGADITCRLGAALLGHKCGC